MSDIGYSRNFRLAPNLTNDRASDVPIARATKACQPTDRGRLSAQIRCNGWLRMIPWTAKAHRCATPWIPNRGGGFLLRGRAAAGMLVVVLVIVAAIFLAHYL